MGRCRFAHVAMAVIVLLTVGAGGEAAASRELPASGANIVAAAAKQCPGAEVATDPQTDVRTMRCLVNAVRRSMGRRSLRDSRLLDRSAALRVREIVLCGDFSHTPCGQPFMRVFSAVGYLRRGGVVGENLAWGQDELGSPLATLRGWLASTPHRANLLRDGWRETGLAVVSEPSLFGLDNVTLWVLQFGSQF